MSDDFDKRVDAEMPGLRNAWAEGLKRANDLSEFVTVQTDDVSVQTSFAERGPSPEHGLKVAVAVATPVLIYEWTKRQSSAGQPLGLAWLDNLRTAKEEVTSWAADCRRDEVKAILSWIADPAWVAEYQSLRRNAQNFKARLAADDGSAAATTMALIAEAVTRGHREAALTPAELRAQAAQRARDLRLVISSRVADADLTAYKKTVEKVQTVDEQWGLPTMLMGIALGPGVRFAVWQRTFL